jgi:hypothetical protein
VKHDAERDEEGRNQRDRKAGIVSELETVSKSDNSEECHIQVLFSARRVSRRRRPEARAPASRASSIIGPVVAAWTEATAIGDDESEVISQAAPTLCIQRPTLATRAAVHSVRKTGCWSGPQAEGGTAGPVADVVVGDAEPV